MKVFGPSIYSISRFFVNLGPGFFKIRSIKFDFLYSQSCINNASRNKTILDAVDLDTPSWEQDTTGLWIDVPKTLLDLFRTKGINPAEAIHAAQHAVLNRFSMAQDLRTECKAPEKEYKIAESKRKRPARYSFWLSSFFLGLDKRG